MIAPKKMPGAPPPVVEDDGFGEFRNEVRGLPPQERQARLKAMEDAVLENLRKNVLGDLYEEQAPPVTAPAPAPAGEDDVDYDTPEYRQYEQDSNAEIDADTGMSPQERRGAKDEVYMGYKPAAPNRSIIDDEEEPEVFADVASPTKFQGMQSVDASKPGFNYGGADPEQQARWRQMSDQPPGPGEMGAMDATEEDPDQPPYTEPLPPGTMKGKPYPTEEEFGGGDAFYSNLYRWEKDNGAFNLEFGSPEYKQFVDDYTAKLGGGGPARPPAPNARSGMFGRPPGPATRMMLDQ